MGRAVRVHDLPVALTVDQSWLSMQVLHACSGVGHDIVYCRLGRVDRGGTGDVI